MAVYFSSLFIFCARNCLFEDLSTCLQEFYRVCVPNCVSASNLKNEAAYSHNSIASQEITTALLKSRFSHIRVHNIQTDNIYVSHS